LFEKGEEREILYQLLTSERWSSGKECKRITDHGTYLEELGQKELSIYLY